MWVHHQTPHNDHFFPNLHDTRNGPTFALIMQCSKQLQHCFEGHKLYTTIYYGITTYQWEVIPSHAIFVLSMKDYGHITYNGWAKNRYIQKLSNFNTNSIQCIEFVLKTLFLNTNSIYCIEFMLKCFKWKLDTLYRVGVEKLSFSTQIRYNVTSSCWKLCFWTSIGYIVSTSCLKSDFPTWTGYNVSSSCLKFSFFNFWFFSIYLGSFVFV